MRTDVHAPASADFDPEAYDFYGCFDNKPEVGNYDPALLREQIAALVARGFRFGSGGSHKCGHCGVPIRYVALLVREDAREFICVGETCLDQRFSGTKAEFDAKRKAAKERAERSRLEGKTAALIEAHPALAYASYAHNISVAGERQDTCRDRYCGVCYGTGIVQADWDLDGYDMHKGDTHLSVVRGTRWVERTRQGWAVSTLEDIWYKAAKYGKLSDKQIAFALSLLDRLSEADERLAVREAEQAAKVAAGVEAPEGRVEVTGTVRSTKFVDNDFGGALKMTVELDSGARVYGTVPAAIDEVEAGSRVRFTATFERSRDDRTFGFYKRPAKAQIVEATA